MIQVIRSNVEDLTIQGTSPNHMCVLLCSVVVEEAVDVSSKSKPKILTSYPPVGSRRAGNNFPTTTPRVYRICCCGSPSCNSLLRLDPLAARPQGNAFKIVTSGTPLF